MTCCWEQQSSLKPASKAASRGQDAHSKSSKSFDKVVFQMSLKYGNTNCAF